MTAILARVHEVLAAAGQDADDDLDLDPALAACVQRVRVHFKAPWRRGAAFADMSVPAGDVNGDGVDDFWIATTHAEEDLVVFGKTCP